jgi:hypothetical protein
VGLCCGLLLGSAARDGDLKKLRRCCCEAGGGERGCTTGVKKKTGIVILEQRFFGQVSNVRLGTVELIYKLDDKEQHYAEARE